MNYCYAEETIFVTYYGSIMYRNKLRFFTIDKKNCIVLFKTDVNQRFCNYLTKMGQITTYSSEINLAKQ